MVGGATLDCRGNDVLRLFDCVFLRLGFDCLRLGGGTALDFVEERVLEFRRGLFLCHARYPFQLLTHIVLGVVELVFDVFETLAVFFEVLALPLHLFELFVEGVLFLVEVVLLAVECALFLDKTVFRPLPFRPLFLGLALEFGAEFVLLFLCFEKSVFADCFCFKSCFFEDSCRFSFCQADFVLRIKSVYTQPRQTAYDKASDGYSCNRSGFECGKQ